MGAAVIQNARTTELKSGERMLIARAALSCSYATGGETLDISAYISGTPVVSMGGSGNAAPVCLAVHDGGTAAAGKIRLFTTSNGNSVSGLGELGNTANVALVVIPFTAVGTAV